MTFLSPQGNQAAPPPDYDPSNLSEEELKSIELARMLQDQMWADPGMNSYDGAKVQAWDGGNYIPPQPYPAYGSQAAARKLSEYVEPADAQTLSEAREKATSLKAKLKNRYKGRGKKSKVPSKARSAEEGEKAQGLPEEPVTPGVLGVQCIVCKVAVSSGGASLGVYTTSFSSTPLVFSVLTEQLYGVHLLARVSARTPILCQLCRAVI